MIRGAGQHKGSAGEEPSFKSPQRVHRALIAISAAGLLAAGPATAAQAGEPPPGTSPPETTIDSGPEGTTQERQPRFTFSASGPGSSFECRFDELPFEPCSGPGQSHAPTQELDRGDHAFEVRAIDAALNVDPTPARGEFTVKVPLAFELTATRVSPRLIFVDGQKPARLRFRFSASRPVALRVRVVNRATGRAVRGWQTAEVAPGRARELRWNGTKRGGRPAPEGRYAFEVGPAKGKLRRAGIVALRGHSFPIDGPHRDRGPVGEFGAPRPGGSHTGFDINSRCGTRVVAARGGRVREAGYDAILGNYVIIDGRLEDREYVYLHLQRPPAVRRGDRVRTAQRIGVVGRTGNAVDTPCHLHFAIWRGRYRPRDVDRRTAWPIDPEPELKRWDRWS